MSGAVPSYQASALLMAMVLRGLSDDETLWLARAMVDSGKLLDLSVLRRPVLDKHSSGGVGDKVTLVLAPLVAACGAIFGKMSGRGLGHTGGTLDKLESIPGFRMQLPQGDFLRQLERIGVAVVSQSERIVPADRLLYALRDVTGTVECDGLIAASIMAKKVASGTSALVLDLKVGRGAFAADLEQAQEIGRLCRLIGAAYGRPTTCLYTAMDAPLGRTVGNRLEVEEAWQVLKGEGPGDVREVALALAAELLPLADLGIDGAEARIRAEAALDDGRAAEHFERWCYVQGGRWQPGEFHRLAGARGQGALGRVRDGRGRPGRRTRRSARGRRTPHGRRHRRRGRRRRARAHGRRCRRGRRVVGGRVLARSGAARAGERRARDRLHRRSGRSRRPGASCSAARTRRPRSDGDCDMRVVGGAWRGRPLQAPAGRNTDLRRTRCARPSSTCSARCPRRAIRRRPVMSSSTCSPAAARSASRRSHAAPPGAPSWSRRRLRFAPCAATSSGSACRSCGPSRGTLLRPPPPRVPAPSSSGTDVRRALSADARRGARYTLVFADPPYDAYEQVRPALVRLLGRVLVPGAVLVVESAAGTAAGLPWTVVREKRYGDTRVTFLVNGAGSPAEGDTAD